MRGRIAEHGITGARKFFFRFFGYVARQAGKNKIAIERRRGAPDDDLSHTVGHVAGQAPGTSLREGFSLRAVGCGERGYFELRMVLEQLNETLADHASRSENTNAKFLVYHLV